MHRNAPSRPPADDDLRKLYATAAALAVEADQLRGEADDLAYRTSTHQEKAGRFRDRLERFARKADPRPPLAGE
jgi:hypothetical protein